MRPVILSLQAICVCTPNRVSQIRVPGGEARERQAFLAGRPLLTREGWLSCQVSVLILLAGQSVARRQACCEAKQITVRSEVTPPLHQPFPVKRLLEARSCFAQKTFQLLACRLFSTIVRS